MKSKFIRIILATSLLGAACHDSSEPLTERDGDPPEASVEAGSTVEDWPTSSTRLGPHDLRKLRTRVTAPSQAGDGPIPDIMMSDHIERSEVLNWQHDWEYYYPNGDDESIFGGALRGAGDLNGDGYDDIIVGDWEVNGSAFIFYGGPDGPSASPDWEHTSPRDGSSFGFSVTGAGDVNGDGYDDVIIGAPGYSDGVNAEGDPAEQGAFYIVHGADDGLGADPDREYLGDEVGAQLGSAVASAGDIDGDGYADVMVGAPGANDFDGVVNIYTGSAAGLSQSPTWQLESPGAGANFGFAVALAGDVDGDGHPDILVGAPTYSEGALGEGAVFLYLGGPDGPADQPDWQATSGQAEALLGFEVTGAGDLNGDGLADIAAGAPTWDEEETDEGAVYVWYADGQTLEQDPGWQSFGGREETFLGRVISGGGDVNGDGYDDLLLGYTQFANVSQGGELYRGSPDGLEEDLSWQAVFEGHANIGDVAHLVGDIDGDGFADMIVGAPRFDAIFLYYGSACFDADGDGFKGTHELSCPAGEDCHDMHARANPDADEMCDNLDTNCNGVVDQDCDKDGDGYCDAQMPAWVADGNPDVCPNGVGDCDDNDPNVHPGVPEDCNFEDDNCNGQIDEAPQVCGGAETICFQGGCFGACEVDDDCDGGLGCYDGRCANSPCEDVECPASNQECYMGTCQLACQIDAPCRVNDKTCVDGRCAADPCEGVICRTSEVCDDGDCVDPDAQQPDAGGDAGQPDTGPDAGSDGGGAGGGDGGGGGCTSAPTRVPPAGAAIFAAIFVGMLWRRERNR